MRVLLVEPDYKSKFPPLGLLKIGTFHQDRGDEVVFVRGMNENQHWDRIYITTLFSFHHQKVINTILHYKAMLRNDVSRLFIGGGYATLHPQVIFNETGVYPVCGLLNKPNSLGFGEDDSCIDSLIPDYSLLEQIDYDYGLKDCYFGYATRGCIRHCPFCAVPKLEPEFNGYTGLKKYIENIKEKYGERQNIVLMDNNVLASKEFNRIINDLVELGFEKGAKFNNRSRFVDFNQGLDGRFITKEKAKQLSKICLRPVRVAYDTVTLKDRFEHSIKLLSDAGFTDFSTYILYNFEDKDTSKDFYERLAHCIALNEKLKIDIYSFPMRYTPLDSRDRTYRGKHWNKKMISGLQRIMTVTQGIVMPERSFFERAYGKTPEEFEAYCAMPDYLIMSSRRKDEDNPEAAAWRDGFLQLTPSQKKEYWEVINLSTIDEAITRTTSISIRKLLEAFPQKKNDTPLFQNSGLD
jgi:hypothetical protein